MSREKLSNTFDSLQDDARRGVQRWNEGTGARCGDRHILDAFSPKVSIMCPKMWPNPTMCPNDSQNMSNLADYVQKASKLLTFFWTFVVRHTKHVQTARKCPKYVNTTCPNFGHIDVWFLQKEKCPNSKEMFKICPKYVQSLDTLWTHWHYIFFTKESVQTLRICPKYVHNVFIMCPNFVHILAGFQVRTFH